MGSIDCCRKSLSPKIIVNSRCLGIGTDSQPGRLCIETSRFGLGSIHSRTLSSHLRCNNSRSGSITRR